MAVFAMFNIVSLAIGLFELALVGTCLVAFILGFFIKSRVVIAASVLLPMAFLALGYFLTANAPANLFPALKTPPVEASIPGTYVLDPISFEYLKSRGFTDLSATIALHDDRSFAVARMPHLWTDGAPESSGYDTCAGRWSVGVNPTEETYNVTMMADKSILPMGAVFLDILAPTGKRQSYALAVPIFYGDFDYLYFVREDDRDRR